MEPLKSVAVFGLGALGLSVIQAAKKAGASDIVGVDINEGKFEAAKAMGADHFVNPMKGANGGKDELLGRHKWGYDYTFDCTGNVNVMRSALEVQCTTYVYYTYIGGIHKTCGLRGGRRFAKSPSYSITLIK